MRKEKLQILSFRWLASKQMFMEQKSQENMHKVFKKMNAIPLEKMQEEENFLFVTLKTLYFTMIIIIIKRCALHT